MKTLLITLGGVAGLLLATPAFAAPAGYGGVSYTHLSTDPGNQDGNGWLVDGSVALDTGSSLGVALNAGVGDDDLPGSDTDWGVGGHVFGHLGQGLVGGFASYNDAGNNAKAWSFGGEAQYNFTGFTLGGAASWLNPDNSSVYDDAWGIDGQAKIFATDNLRLSGNVGYGKFNGKGIVPDDHEWTVGVGAEWQLASLPISIVGDYAHIDFDKANVSGDAFRIGARYTWGGTLKTRSDSGADLHSISTLGGRFGF